MSTKKAIRTTSSSTALLAVNIIFTANNSLKATIPISFFDEMGKTVNRVFIPHGYMNLFVFRVPKI